MHYAGAILYPKRILIETWHSEPDGFSIVSDQITFIETGAADHEIGELLVKHLDLSLMKIPTAGSHNGFKTMGELYKEATGLKTLRAQMKDAKYVSVCRQNNSILLTPTINGGPTGVNAGYSHKTDEEITVENNADYAAIGRALREAWTYCE